MINYTVTINGGSVQVKQGFTTTQELSEALDSGTIIIPYSTQKSRYPMFSEVVITITDSVGTTTLNYRLSTDFVTLSSKNPLLYQHTIQLIEPTKSLERQTGGTLTFIQPTDGTVRYTMLDVINRICNTMPFDTVANYPNNRNFTVDSTLATYLQGIKAPQFFINRPTQLGAINQVLKYLNAIGHMHDFSTLSADFFNQLLTVIDESNTYDYGESQNLETYATTLDSYVDNQIVQSNTQQDVLVYPSATGWASVRSDDLQLTTNNMVFQVPDPIYQIVKVEMWCTAQYQTPTSSETLEIQTDITPLVVESQVWASLETPSVVDRSTVNKRNAVEYDYQGTEIYGFGTTYGFFTDSVLNELLAYVLTNNYGLTVSNVSLSSPFQEIMYRVTYIPIYNSRIQAERNNISDTVQSSTIYSNQEARIVDLEAYMNNLNGQVNMLANGEMQLSVYCKTFADAFQMGQYTADNWIVTKVVNAYFNDFIVSQATFSKNFNRISDYIGINSEIRQYEIPGSGFTLERHEHYSEYIELSPTAGTHTAYVTESGRGSFMFTMTNTQYSGQDIRGVLFTANLSDGSSRYLYLACNSVGAINSLIFTFGFADNTNAGNQIVASGTQWINQFLRYTNDDGTLDTFNLQYVTGFSTNYAYADFVTVAQTLPEIDTAYVDSPLIQTPDFNLMKDPGEVFKMTYQLQILPAAGYENNYVVGRSLTKYNYLVGTPDKTNTTLSIWLSTETYGKFDNLYAKGSISALTYSVDATADTLTVNNLPSTTVAWALADQNGNLYLAVNGNSNTVYFTFKNKR